MNAEQIGAAAFLFELERGVKLGSDELSVIADHHLSIADTPQMVRSIKEFIATDPSPDLRASAFWALGKRYDNALLNFFRSGLTSEIERDPRVVYQIMIALENLGEPIFSPKRAGRSYDEDQLNVADAKAYLAGL